MDPYIYPNCYWRQESFHGDRLCCCWWYLRSDWGSFYHRTSGQAQVSRFNSLFSWLFLFIFSALSLSCIVILPIVISTNVIQKIGRPYLSDVEYGTRNLCCNIRKRSEIRGTCSLILRTGIKLTQCSHHISIDCILVFIHRYVKSISYCTFVLTFDQRRYVMYNGVLAHTS